MRSLFKYNNSRRRVQKNMHRIMLFGKDSQASKKLSPRVLQNVVLDMSFFYVHFICCFSNIVPLCTECLRLLMALAFHTPLPHIFFTLPFHITTRACSHYCMITTQK